MAKTTSALTCGCPVAAFQKMISGKYKLRIVWDLQDGPKRYSEIRTGLLRGARRHVSDRAPRALARIEGAHRAGPDRPQGFWRRSAQGRISADPKRQKFCARHCRHPQLGRAAPGGSERK